MTKSSYDELPYHSVLGYEFQPNALASLSALHGFSPPAMKKARILELGCGDGTNIIAIAQSLPDAECWGVDISEKQLAAAQKTVDEVGLKNVTLKQIDLMEVNESLGQFDYISVHGLFSWIPAELQDKILSICKNNLAFNGLACISYNTLPGWNMLKTTLDMMRFHQQHIDNSSIEHRIAEARGLLQIAADIGQEQQSFYGVFLQERLQTLSKQSDDYLFHEYLEGVNQPLYFHEFVTKAEQHDLAYVTDVDFRSSLNVKTKHQHVFDQLAKKDRVTREQYHDFLFNRSYRSSILCHAGQKINPEIDAKALAKLQIAAFLTPETNISSLVVEPKPAYFKTQLGQRVEVKHTLTQAAVNYLGQQYPQPVVFDDLFKKVLENMQLQHETEANIKIYREVLSEELLQLYIQNVIELMAYTPAFETKISERPVASPLARWQLKNQKPMANLQCKTGEIDGLTANVLLHLDGERTADDLVKMLSEQVDKGQLQVQIDESKLQPNQTKEQAIHNTLVAAVNNILANIAKNALLVS
ncbi:class I SAM-dependent methyltransferase [Candidatus Albibeggiatoa sp. nov. NOAA]|uniref:class I SAM-dependent methyltransferase n=1 Tax=Candidatus Albibeggiatoa sp. nov. NOAA TaxID=3162724 RepID=UPI0032F5F7F8|nr:class I SAM-dependent methyltransferase [Thiotrichaceae bacterium]